MSIATTATRPELVALAVACDKLVEMLREVEGGSGSPAKPGRYTAAQIDAQIVVVDEAITAATA